MSSDRISSPFGISFSSALCAAASDEVSIPAARWRCARRSFTIFGRASTNHLDELAQYLVDSTLRCVLFTASVGNLVPWALLKKGIVAFDYDQASTRRHSDSVLNGIFSGMIEAWCVDEDLRFVARGHRRSFENFHKVHEGFSIEGERGTTSPES